MCVARCTPQRRGSQHTISEQTGNHELGSVANRVDGAIFDHYALVGGQEGLERGDNLSEVRLVSSVVVHPLSIENIMQGHEILGLIHSTTSDSSKLLHVSANTEQKTQVDAEGTDVGSGLAGNPENAEIYRGGKS